MHIRLAHALPLALGLLCAASLSSDGMLVSRAVAGLAVTTDPSPALVFLDGKFIGESSGELVIHTSPGLHQLRVSESAYLDIVSAVQLTEGMCSSVHVTLPTPTDTWPLLPEPIAIAAGQVMRGKLVRGPDGNGIPVRYSVDETTTPHRMLTQFSGQIMAKVTGPEGEIVVLVPMPITLPGVPGNNHHEYRGARAGRYIIEVNGKPGAFAFRLGAGPPAVSTSEAPGKKGRRLAPGNALDGK